MTKELRGYISRVRKAQDAILNGKATDKTANLELDVSLSSLSGEPFMKATAFNHRDKDDDDTKCTACEYVRIWPWTPSEEIEERFKVLSEVIGYQI